MRVDGADKIENLRLGIVSYQMGERPYKENLLISEETFFTLAPTGFVAFQDINEDNTISNENNIELGTRISQQDGKPIESNYLFIKVDSPDTFTGKGYFQLRWFFDYEESEIPFVPPGEEQLSSSSSQSPEVLSSSSSTSF